jgi:hypothetical protein
VGGCRSSGYAFDFCKQGHASEEGDAKKIDLTLGFCYQRYRFSLPSPIQISHTLLLFDTAPKLPFCP